MEPTMNSEDLHRTLERLRGELRQTPSLDEESRRLLQDLARDAERLPNGPGAATHSWGERLEALAVRFEADHPTLGASLRELMEILGRAGV
jgi:hypothetical protein